MPRARIDDPKTSAVVGGMLCALAEGQIEGFLLRSSRFTLRSTARFIGEMEISGQIMNERLLYADIDLENRPAGEETAVMRFYAPTFVGFRQLALERWTATPLYYLEFLDPQRASRLQLAAVGDAGTGRGSTKGDEAKREDFPCGRGGGCRGRYETGVAGQSAASDLEDRGWLLARHRDPVAAPG